MFFFKNESNLLKILICIYLNVIITIFLVFLCVIFLTEQKNKISLKAIYSKFN